MRTARSPQRSLAVGVAASLLALTACSSSSQSPSTPSTSAPAPSESGVSAAKTLAPLSGGKAGISGPGVTASTITIGQISTVSGPLPGFAEAANQALDAFVAMVNSAGGLEGRKLKVVRKDDGGDCATYTNAIRSLADEAFAIVASFAIQDTCGKTTLKANPSLPNIESDLLDPSLYTLPNSFSGLNMPPGYPTGGFVWVKKRYPSSINKMGALYAAGYIYPESKKAAQSLGFKYVYERTVPLTTGNYTSQIIAMRSAGVKVVDLATLPVNVIAKFVQQAEQLGFAPDAIISDGAYDANFFPLLGGGVSASNVIMPLRYPMFLGEDRDSNPALAEYLTWLQKTSPKARANFFGVTAWAAATMFAQGVLAADKSGPVTRQSLLDGIRSLNAFSANGLMPPSDPGKLLGPSCLAVVGIDNGKYVRLDPQRGYECDGTYLKFS